uniref:Uncharacterized protein n=1 Tax=Anguilla anguilla TaxID=7936 RepID=A0A0E9S2C2_ANGAN
MLRLLLVLTEPRQRHPKDTMNKNQRLHGLYFNHL